MGLIERIFSWGAYLVLERPGQDKDYTEHARLLEEAGRTVLNRLESKEHSDFNHRVLTHIIGIEKWGQSRLRVFLGAPLKDEEYLVYRPARDVPWAELVERFRATRVETLSIVGELQQARIGPDDKVRHNQYGPLSAKAWLAYLRTHASREVIQVR